MQGDTSTKLLQAAERILIKEGVRALTTRRVGEVSDLNPTLITYHFGSITKLLATLLDHNMEPMRDGWRRLEQPLRAGCDPVDDLLERWLSPLMAPAAYNPRGRALVAIDEIAAHGEADMSRQVIDCMAGTARIVRNLLAPHLPGLTDQELRIRLRFIAGATLGPPPRARLTLSEPDPAMGPDALATLLRFARMALADGRAGDSADLAGAAQARQ